ncbi:MAG TPA: ABC transporter permease [Candidatus Acidoferrales bacterium]|nr:ABC transporter permease [Candidatus Acidoferrales bacterium]
MPHLREFLARFGGLFRSAGRERELADELQSHLDLAIADNVHRGMKPGEARRSALLSLGGVEQAKAAWREQRGVPWLENLLGDFRYALRLAARSPGFALAAVLALALGIGANGAIFSVLDQALLRPLPYPHADRLVFFGMLIPSADSRPFLFASSYVELRGQQTPFESMASWRPGTGACDLTESQPVRLACARVESTFLPTFGASPVLGRNFTADEDRAGGPNVCLISYGLWESHFGGKATALGRRLSLDGTPTTIIGILPREFEWPTLARVDVVLPEVLSPAELSAPLAGVVRAYARLKPRVSLDQARAELEPATNTWRRALPPMFRRDMRLALLSVRDDQVGDTRQALLVLLGAALALLLLGCANVANMLLARSASRQRELAVRAALGASRWRVARLQLIESSLLGVEGGILGAGLAYLLLRLFVALAPAGIPRIRQAGLDAPVLLFVVAASLLAGLLCSLAPALAARSSRALFAGRALGPPRGRLGAALVAAQVATSLVLVAGAGLFLDTLRHLESVPLGMDASKVITAEITLGPVAYRQPGAASQFFDRLETKLRELPGVAGVAMSDSLPPTGGEHAHPFYAIRVEGRLPFEKGTGGLVGWRIVTPGYFQMLGIPIVEGRGFVASDQEPESNSIVLNQKLAARLFPDRQPIGGHLQLSPPSGPWYDVVGVAGDVKYVENSGFVAPASPEYYLPVNNAPAPGPGGADATSELRHAFVLVRSPLAAGGIERLVRGEIASLDPTLPASISMLETRVDLLRIQPRFNAALISLFAALGLLLAALGIYGVLSFLVAGRTRELGVRMALGAMPQGLVRMVLWGGLRLVLAGLVAGVALGLAAARLLKGLLYGVSAGDPKIFAAAALVLLAAALAACAIPARRAARIDPVAALRNE